MTDQQQLVELLRRQLAGESTADLLGEATGDNPQLGQLAELLRQREEKLQRDLAAAEQAEALEAEEASRLAERQERAEGVRHRVAELTAQLDAACSMLDDLAAALGACPDCFGTDDACRWCRGRGAPGFTNSDPDLFDRLVRPAVVRHARLHRRETTTDRPPMREGTPQ
jgi:hypothetical protein